MYIYIYGATRELPNFQGVPKIECPCKLMGIRSRPLLNSIVSRSQLWDREVIKLSVPCQGSSIR